MGQDKPQLKKCFKNEMHALEVFEKELKQNLSELQKHGLFFSFTTDPLIEDTRFLTWCAVGEAIRNSVPCKILTKNAAFAHGFINDIEHCDIMPQVSLEHIKKYIAFGLTLTGHDELEPNASPNADRIKAIKILHNAGFKTFASVEPIVDLDSSLQMLFDIRDCCDLAKIGLMSGKKYNKNQLRDFITKCIFWSKGEWFTTEPLKFNGFKIYFKDSLLKQAGVDRKDLSASCVGRDYNLFNP